MPIWGLQLMFFIFKYSVLFATFPILSFLIPLWVCRKIFGQFINHCELDKHKTSHSSNSMERRSIHTLLRLLLLRCSYQVLVPARVLRIRPSLILSLSLSLSLSFLSSEPICLNEKTAASFFIPMRPCARVCVCVCVCVCLYVFYVCLSLF